MPNKIYTDQRSRLFSALAGGRWRSMPYLIEKMGGYRLSARIWELRARGWVIEMREKRVGRARQTEYRMVLT